MVNRQASSARASWRCSALSSWSSAISGATTSRTWCAIRRSATGSCSAAHPIRWASASRRCSTGSASTPLTITAAWSSETVPAAIASRTGSWSWSRACASSRRRLASRLVCRVGVGPVAAGVGGAGSVPRSRRSAWWADAELELGEPVPQRGERGEGWRRFGRAASTRVRGRRAGRGRRGDGGDRGRDRVRLGSSNTVAIQGILASATDSPGPGMGYSGQLWTSISDSFWSAGCCGLDTRSLALAARPPGEVATTAVLPRATVDQRRTVLELRSTTDHPPPLERLTRAASLAPRSQPRRPRAAWSRHSLAGARCSTTGCCQRILASARTRCRGAPAP